MTFTTTNDQEANSRVRDFFSQNNNYNLINTTLFRYADDGVTRRPVNLSPAASAGGQEAPSTAEGTPGTFIVTYLSPQGNEQQTAYDASSATEAATLFRMQHPASYRLQEITRLQESVTESKKPKQPKTIIDGAMKTLINKGRSEDEAIADLKKEIDKKFYSEDVQISENFEKTPKGWKHPGHFGRPVTYQPLPRWNTFSSYHRNAHGSYDDITHYMGFITDLYSWHIQDLTGDEIANAICKIAGTNPKQELNKFNQLLLSKNPDFKPFKNWSYVFDKWKEHTKIKAMTAFGGGRR
jgi:hypothetical protein